MDSDLQRPIMLVDDNADDLVYLRRQLDGAGVRNPMVAFVSSEDALAYLESMRITTRLHPELCPCVLFLDLKMPQLSGMELLKFVRSQPEFNGLMIVVLTSSVSPDDREMAAELGADRYLIKFPLPEVLAEIIEGALALRARA